jgi:hypothetical protein
MATVAFAVLFCLAGLGQAFGQAASPPISSSPGAQTSQPDDVNPQNPAPAQPAADTQSTGGEHLSGKEVKELPLNKRDFSQLLLLAAGTMTDSNGAANFTQQFAVNGQRGSTTVFSMDGIDTTDPQMGGATFSNFNVDAIREVQSSSGVMPAEIGHGAAGFTEIVTKSGTDALHGTVFEFLRNAALDARNFFDERTIASPGRIPPFVRNEFGFTIGGPLVIPGVYNGRQRTYFFGQYQGFRQVLSSTQVISVPSMQERLGVDSTAFPGDTLVVPVSAQISSVLARYPLPNDPQGAFGNRTYATSARVTTDTDQFSIRIDHRISDLAQFFGRFTLNQNNGPLTNPDQVTIDPTFETRFFDHQRNGGFRYARTLSPHFTSEETVGVERSTPFFPSNNSTQPGLLFSDALYDSFNTPAGTQIGAFTSLIQLRQAFTLLHGAHAVKFGFESRFNRDTAVFDPDPNGAYTFGGGTAYAQEAILSASGQHNIQSGAPLPDTLTAFLTGTPFAYTIPTSPPYFPQGSRMGEAAVRRNAYNFYFQDTWKLSPRFSVDYGLRYEVESRIHEAHDLTSGIRIVSPQGTPAVPWQEGATLRYFVNPQPPYSMDWRGWGPRLSLDWRMTKNTVWHAGGGITTILTDLWQDNFLVGNFPFLVAPNYTALPGVPVNFVNEVTRPTLPPLYNVDGQLIYGNRTTAAVLPNTEIDVTRFESDLQAFAPGHQAQQLASGGMAPDFRNGYIGTYTAGFEHSFGDLKFSASYVATAGIHLGAIQFINGYPGAQPAFAPFAKTDANGNIIGGFSVFDLMSTRSHSTYHALQSSAEKTSARLGLGFQASYTYSKALDDTSAVLGGLFASSGPVLQTVPQDPRHPGLEKGPSTFDTPQVFTLSLVQVLPFDKLNFLRPINQKVTSGWQLLNITTVTSGSRFSVYSGVQQTGVGSYGADRPDQIGRPVFSTSRHVREDYFGLGSANASFFEIPIGVPGGTGPNQGVFGTLGRDTFRGPDYKDLDFSLIKDTTFGRRGNSEAMVVQFRAEFFNAFNLVNFGLPMNVIRGSGFGIINRTAGTSRQIQFSLKLNF